MSRFRKTGERAFLFNGVVSRLGIPLTATITPIEITGGYRIRLGKYPSIVPYVGAGAGSYTYRETSATSDTAENVDTKHTGWLAVGGVEQRVRRWFAVSVDVQYTHIPGILGNGGISQEAKEQDLGGISARLKLIVGL